MKIHKWSDYEYVYTRNMKYRLIYDRIEFMTDGSPFVCEKRGVQERYSFIRFSYKNRSMHMLLVADIINNINKYGIKIMKESDEGDDVLNDFINNEFPMLFFELHEC